MHILALILLTLVGYSVGAALAASKRRDALPRVASPSLLDLGLIVALWVVALTLQPILGKWLSIAVWMFAAGAVAWAWTRSRRAKLPVDKTPAPAPANGFFKRLWQGWTCFARRMGNFQGRVLLAFFYFGIVTPFGLLVRLFADPLHIKPRKKPSFWLDRAPTATDLDQMRSQF